MSVYSKGGLGLAVVVMILFSCGRQGNETVPMSGKRVVKLRGDTWHVACQGTKEIAGIPSLHALLIEIVPGSEEVAGACLASSPDIAYSEPLSQRVPLWIPGSLRPYRGGDSPASRNILPQAVPPPGVQVNDPFYSADSPRAGLPAQWGLYDINPGNAWQNTPDLGSSVTVAVIDSGLDIGHPEFTAAGKVIGTYNAVTSTQTFTDMDVTDTVGHGTHVAGIIGAATDNGTGIASIGYRVQILAVKIINGPAGTTDSFTLAGAIVYAADHGARVINLSLGGPERSGIERDALAYAVSHGTVVAIAAGNSALSDNVVSYPGLFAPEIQGVLCVGAIAPSAGVSVKQVAGFSTHNFGLTIAAPGVDVLSTVPRSMGAYAYASGTSMAAPFVAGAAALVMAKHPALGPGDVVYRLRSTVQPALPLPPGATDPFSYYYGAGELDAGAATQD